MIHLFEDFVNQENTLAKIEEFLNQKFEVFHKPVEYFTLAIDTKNSKMGFVGQPSLFYFPEKFYVFKIGDLSINNFKNSNFSEELVEKFVKSSKFYCEHENQMVNYLKYRQLYASTFIISNKNKPVLSEEAIEFFEDMVVDKKINSQWKDLLKQGLAKNAFNKNDIETLEIDTHNNRGVITSGKFNI